jgi:hypothetical protein
MVSAFDFLRTNQFKPAAGQAHNSWCLERSGGAKVTNIFVLALFV